MQLLEARNLRFAYGERLVLDDLSLRVGAGTVVGLVGPNGAGKTTLLRSLAGLIEPRGEIRYGDLPIRELSSRQLATWRAFVPQSLEASFPFSVEDVVAMGRSHTSRLYAAKAARELIESALSEVGCRVPLERRLDCLSGGERQQVVVARALVQSARILLLDEPTSALDLPHRAALVAALRRRAAEGAAIILSMHDLNLAGSVCDRLLLLNRGHIVVQGPPHDVLQPEHLHEAYGARLLCSRSQLTGAPVIEVDLETAS